MVFANATYCHIRKKIVSGVCITGIKLAPPPVPLGPGIARSTFAPLVRKFRVCFVFVRDITGNIRNGFYSNVVQLLRIYTIEGY